MGRIYILALVMVVIAHREVAYLILVIHLIDFMHVEHMTALQRDCMSMVFLRKKSLLQQLLKILLFDLAVRLPEKDLLENSMISVSMTNVSQQKK